VGIKPDHVYLHSHTLFDNVLPGFPLRADLAMYEAKNAGGNRVVMAAKEIGV